MSGAAGALNPAPTGTAEIRPLDDGVEIRSGRIRATVNHAGVMSFFRGDTLVLREYYRNYDGTISPESSCLKIASREMKALVGDAWRLAVCFESRDGETLYGMGQYQQPPSGGAGDGIRPAGVGGLPSRRNVGIPAGRHRLSGRADRFRGGAAGPDPRISQKRLN